MQSELNPDTLAGNLKNVKENWASYVKRSTKRKSPDLNASEELFSLIESNIK